MATDLTFTRSPEFMVTMIQGNTEAGIAFVESWLQPQMMVFDLGIILIRDSEDLEMRVNKAGLTHDFKVAGNERQS